MNENNNLNPCSICGVVPDISGEYDYDFFHCYVYFQVHTCKVEDIMQNKKIFQNKEDLVQWWNSENGKVKND